MGFIHVNEVIFKLKSFKEATLEYVRATGSSRGSIKKIRCIYGWKDGRTAENPKRSASASRGSGQKMILEGKIPIVDLDSDRPNQLFISHIIACDGEKVKH